jgi:serine/threonine-protein kinase
MSFQVGDAIGDYQVIAVLGAGGMGQVYKVRNVISDRVEAMKVLLPDLVNEPELGDRFLREIKVQASLDHPNIAKLHTALRAGNQLVMVMELVEGTTLEQLLEQGPIPLDDGLRYISDSLEALGYAHERGVIHRDIKPANIMLTHDGVIKLMDFGIAKAAADRKLTMTGTTMGSLYYMSPEQVKGVTTLDPRSDLYSLGITLYEVVTGRRPFQGDSDYAIMSAHLEKMPVPPIEMDPHLPAALNEIILQAIAKNPDERFQTAAAFQKALNSVRRVHAPAAAEPERTRVAPRAPAPRREPPRPAPEPFIRPAKSHRGLYVLAGSVLTLVILLVAGIQVANWRKTRAGGAALPAEPPAQEAPPQTPPPAGPPAQGGQTPPVAPAPAPREPAAQPKAKQTAPVQQTPVVQQAPAQAPPRSPGPAAPAPAPTTPAAERAVQSQTPPAPAPPRSNPALAELRERAVFLASRASTVRNALTRLESQQARMGTGLRPDMAAANERMDFLMKEAGAALSAGDADATKRHLDLAEREVEKLEKFLGK